MTAALFVRFLHLFFAFSFVGALVVAEWNSRGARRTQDWGQRAMLWDLVRVSSIAAGLVGLLLLGVLGNVLAWQLHVGRAGSWLMWVNGIWIVTLLVYVLLCIPGASRLVRICAEAAGGGSAEAYTRTLAYWRVSNMLITLLYLVLLALMVLRRAAPSV